MHPFATRYPFAVMAACVLFAGCHFSRYSHTIRSSSGSARLEAHGDGPVYVAFYENGELYGAEAWSRLGASRYGSWARHREALDHPNLSDWRDRLARAQDLAADTDTSVSELIHAFASFPFWEARQDVYDTWRGSSPQRSAALLDRIEDLNVRRSYALKLSEKALVFSIEDRRAAGWMDGFANENFREAAAALANSPALGDQTARTALRRIDDFSSSFRRKIFAAAAESLVANERDATLIVQSADGMRSSDAAGALQDLLEIDKVSPSFPIEVLRELDERSSRYRPTQFSLAADRCYHDPSAASTIVRVVDRLSSSRRAAAMRGVLAHRDVPPNLVRGLLAKARRLPSRAREAFLVEFIRGLHFHDDHRALCIELARTLGSRARGRILEMLGVETKKSKHRYF